ncbi:MAB_1171c family putative transporter [Streptomyces sp. NPDC059788]|uniref:MAB_1171c family putative transporter n=1 Tax=Streptomyces sp. NPDC059788 TaxID=3346948 RepID=UPI00365FBB69
MTTELTVTGLCCLWSAVLLRCRSAVRSPHQRGLWLAVVTAAVAMTMDLPAVDDFLEDRTGLGHLNHLVRDVFGVLSAGAVLRFVATSGNRRYGKGVYVAVAAMTATLITLDLLAAPHDEHTAHGARSAAETIAYWLILMTMHLLAGALCFRLCWRYAGRTESRSLRLGLRLFGWGTASAGLFWAGHFFLFLLGAGQSVPWLRLLMVVQGVLWGAAILLPVVVTSAGAVGHIGTVWRLWPLWRHLVDAAPHVALMKPRSRLLELLRPRHSWRLLGYRKVIETRDAILGLRGYAGPAVPGLARRYTVTAGLADGEADVVALACELSEARRAKLAGLPRRTAPEGSFGADSCDLDDETAFLLRLARAYRSPHVRRFHLYMAVQDLAAHSPQDRFPGGGGHPPTRSAS